MQLLSITKQDLNLILKRPDQLPICEKFSNFTVKSNALWSLASIYLNGHVSLNCLTAQVMSFQVVQEKCMQIYFCTDKQNQKSLSKQPMVNSFFQMSLRKSEYLLHCWHMSKYSLCMLECYKITHGCVCMYWYIFFNGFKQQYKINGYTNSWEPLVLYLFFKFLLLLYVENTDQLCIYKCSMSSWE